jgi:pyruvate dehydrogenase E1 component alpha subunit
MNKELMKKMYIDMQRIRSFEKRLGELIIKEEIKTPCHLCIGQEAVAVGICSALKKQDYVFGNHRSHGHYLAKGGDIKELMAEIFGRKTGCSKGRGGSMHIVSLENGFLGSVPIVAGTVSLAMGAALSIKIKKEKKVCVSFFGDGATGEGVLYESLNFAALKKLPLIFVCENNFYSTHLPIREIRVDKPIFEIARPFGIISFKIDGNDVLEVKDTAKKAVQLCQKGKGPVFIECQTYRQAGHVGPDDKIQSEHKEIRPKKEIKQWLKKDPIKRFETLLLKKNILKEEEIEKIKKNIDKEIEGAYKFAKDSVYPAKEEITN